MATIAKVGLFYLCVRARVDIESPSTELKPVRKTLWIGPFRSQRERKAWRTAFEHALRGQRQVVCELVGEAQISDHRAALTCDIAPLTLDGMPLHVAAELLWLVRH